MRPPGNHDSAGHGPANRMRRLGVFVATAAYIGYAPVAPGTVGSLGGLALYAVVRTVGTANTELLLLAVIVTAGVWSASVAERYFQKTDPGAIVVDEVAGMLLTLLWIQVSWLGGLVGFLAFRVFDILKPFPARWSERLPGGWGVMVDDLVAGLYAHLTVRLFVWALPAFMVS